MLFNSTVNSVGPLWASVKRKSKYTHVQHNDEIQQYKEELNWTLCLSMGSEPLKLL